MGGWQGATNSIGAEAICVPKSDFMLDPGMEFWVSERIVTGAGNNGARDCSDSGAADAWRGDAATFLTSLQGQFEGGGRARR